MKDSGKIKLGELANDTERVFAILMEQDKRIAKILAGIKREHHNAVKLERKHRSEEMIRAFFCGEIEAYKTALTIFPEQLHVPLLSESVAKAITETSAESAPVLYPGQSVLGEN
jgi:hypothetical protein